ncbi:MAG: SMI1/KNR4 family protein [Simkania sp.]|nr:SMI1/KNR4 family protein [Simkania sp.]
MKGLSVIDYFTGDGGYHDAISLQDAPELSWEKAKEKTPNLPKGWWELSKLDPGVKLEFIRDYWFNALPYQPHVYHFLDTFFAGVLEVGVFLAQKRENSPYEAFFTYRLKDRLYLGRPPLLEKEIEKFKRSISYPLPDDFLNFFRIHNGFAKGGDSGIFSSGALEEERKWFMQAQEGFFLGEKSVDPELLLPFYRSFGLDIYQCFYKDWYPDGEVGNVLCSLSDRAISSWKEDETLAFPTFLDWLVFYLE